jgi:hypothetical protein
MENNTILTNTNQPIVEEVSDSVVEVVTSIVDPRLSSFSWEDKIIIVAKSIEVTNSAGIVTFAQDLEKLSAPTLRMVAKNFGCRNVGSLAKFQVRLQMAQKKTMSTNYNINDASSTHNATTNTKNYIRVINACFHPENFESFLKINDRKDRND